MSISLRQASFRANDAHRDAWVAAWANELSSTKTSSIL